MVENQDRSKNFGGKLKEFANPHNEGMDYKEYTDRVGENLKKFGASPWKHQQVDCRKEILGPMFDCECSKCLEKAREEMIRNDGTEEEHTD